MGLNKDEVIQLEQLIQQSHCYKENEFLFRQDDQFKAIYAIRSGMFKSQSIDQQGNERILGFHLPGELVGLDGIYDQHYPSNMVALDTSTVCAVPYNGLTSLTEKIPSLQQQLLRLLSKEINNVSALTYDTSADQRLASFLFSLSRRYEQRGYSATHFNLVMPRRDIANHLNMAAETISRLFKRMQDSGVITIKRRELSIRDMSELKKIAGCSNQ
jgi:CRP/FNR family transcriptional regulator